MPTLDAEPEKENKEIIEKVNSDKKDSENGIIKDKKDDKMENDANEKVETPVWVESSEGQIEVDDPDDYLIYLDDILKRIHK